MEKTVETRPTRSEVPVELTWDLRDLFASDEAWEAELAEIEKAAAEMAAYKGKLKEGASVLLACLQAQEQISMKLIKAWTFASLRQSADGTDPVNQANSSKLSAVRTKVSAALSFIDSEILRLPDGTVEAYIQQEAGLEPFRRSLHELLEQKRHRLSPETEEALAALGEVLEAPYHIFSMSKLTDMQFSPVEDEKGNELPVSFALFETRYEFSPDAELRKKAYDSFVHTLQQYKNTFAAVYATEVKKQVALSRLRGYESVTEMLLEPQKVSLEMYNNQLDIIVSELAPHMRRYARLKKRVLGLETVRFCDLKAPLDPHYHPSVSYEEASKMILDALQVMGPEYLQIMERGLTERWVDRSDNIGKSTGAFCSSPYGAHPYILITWQNTMRNTFTLAHELGHAGHFFLANKSQRIMNTRPSLYFIEAPSTLNELLLGQHMLAGTNESQMRRWIVLQLLATYYHNFVTHALEGEYQRRVYRLEEKGGALTAASLSEIKGSVLSDFWGDAVDLDEGARLTWMRQPHYYKGLYPYTYSAGLTASTTVAQMIREEGQPAVERWLDVLRAGGTMKPLELLRHAGVDMSNPEPIRKAVAYIGSLIDELERSFE